MLKFLYGVVAEEEFILKAKRALLTTTNKALFFFMQQEIWKPIKGFETTYEVSNLGRVKALKRQDKSTYCVRFLREKILVAKLKFGYLRIRLKKDSKQIYFFVHRLVADAFIPNTGYCMYVRFKDGNVFNCNSDNLYWSHDRIENMNYVGVFTGRKKAIIQIDGSGKEMGIYESISDAAKITGISRVYIQSTLKSKMILKRYNCSFQYKK